MVPLKGPSKEPETVVLEIFRTDKSWHHSRDQHPKAFSHALWEEGIQQASGNCAENGLMCQSQDRTCHAAEVQSASNAPLQTEFNRAFVD